MDFYTNFTGCAVAQHCYNGEVSLLWEKWKIWPPVKSKPFNRLTNNLSGLISSTRRTFVPIFFKKSVHGGLLSKGVKYNFLSNFFIYLLFYYFFFSDQRREETPGRILTCNGSKDAEYRKDVHFLGYKMKNWNLTPIYLKNPKTLALNRQFPAKMMKHETPSISESIKPIEMKI